MIYSDNPYTEILHKHPHQECIRCVMDTSDPWITFNDDGVCNHCQAYDVYMNSVGTKAEQQKRLDQIVAKMKSHGKGKDYEDGKLSLVDLYNIANENCELSLKSGKQELFENIINQYI